jgi:alginate O-acetyltransferase complex protein AlgI
MVFSSFLFLFLFLPCVSLLYAASPRRAKNLVLLLGSTLFYGWGAPQVLPFLLIASAFDYIVGFRLVPGTLSERKRRFLFGFAVAANLSGLLYYKYFNFAAAELSRLFSVVGVTPLTWSPVLLPIGISFFTFHKISYLGDVYRGKVGPARSIIDYCLYILFFPQLIAGPIIRYADVASQFKERVHALDGVWYGLCRLCVGLGKKVLIADSLGAVVDRIFLLNGGELSSGPVWLAAVCYSFQIYFDFSGYSDMAIGLAKVFGFTFKENFDRPYRSHTFTEFWRRWHISLSTFMREYVYIPLGGNRGTALRTHANLWTTFLLSGLWHGASWNFVVWGAYHGAFLTIDRVWWERRAQRLSPVVTLLVTFVLVTIGWVFFRAETLERAVELLGIMFGFWSGSPVPTPRASWIDNRELMALCVAVLATFVPRLPSILAAMDRSTGGAPKFATACVAVGALVTFWLSVAALASRGYAPFLYFRF